MITQDRLLKYGYLLLPFCLVGNQTFATGQYYALMTAIMAGVGLCVTDKWLRGFLLYFALWQAALWASSLLFVRSIILAPNGFEMYATTTLLVLLWAYVSKSEKDDEWFFNIFCIGALIQAVIAWFQVFDIQLYKMVPSPIVAIKSQMGNAITAMLQNNNFLAGFIAISTPFFFRRRWIYFLPLILPLFWPMQTRTAVIALCAGIAFYYRRHWKIILPISISAAIAFMLTTRGLPTETGPETRWDMWGKALMFMFSDWSRLLAGNSPGIVLDGNLHNEYLTLFMKFGFAGLAFLAGYLWNLPRIHRILSTAMVVALVNMMGNYAMELPTTMALITCIAGLLERHRCRK